MFEQLSNSPFLIAAAVFATLGIVLVITGVVALVRANILSFTAQFLLGLLLVLSGVLSGMIALGIQGYHALTREEVAARISVAPIAPQRFIAVFQFPDGRKARYTIAGDEIYIDARILKWQPIANILGLHTNYELDRVGGRYRDINQELHGERTLFELGQSRKVDLFGLRQKHTFLSPLLDAKYGSATYIPVTQAAELELRVSTTGLMLRELLPQGL
jgi:hypothetical protein